MKQKLLLTVIAVVALAVMVGNAQTNNQSMSDKSKTLVAYFSATGTTMETASKLGAKYGLHIQHWNCLQYSMFLGDIIN